MIDVFGVLSFVLAGIAIVARYTYIPGVAELGELGPFWIMLAAYALLAASRPGEKK